jgi:hypothetical protein
MRIRTLVLAGMAALGLSTAMQAQATQTVTVNVSKTETVSLSLSGVPASWSAAAGVDISAGGTVSLGSLVINPSWDLKNNRTVTIDAYFSQDLTGDPADGSPTIPVSAFAGTKQVGAGGSSAVSWSGVGAGSAAVLLTGQTGAGAGNLPRTLDAASTTYDVTFGLSLNVPATTYPSTYTTTLTFRVFTN